MHEHRFQHGVERLRQPERLERLEVKRVADLSLAGLQPGANILDIGTGSGIFAEAFAARGFRVSGVDANPDMLAAARGFVPGADFREAEAEHLPFKDGEFDLAFMGLMLHEADAPLDALKEARRVSRRLAVLEWPYGESPIGPSTAERITPEKLEEMAREAGYNSIRLERLETLALYLL
jgi:SAM-dependent methyltransferase